MCVPSYLTLVPQLCLLVGALQRHSAVVVCAKGGQSTADGRRSVYVFHYGLRQPKSGILATAGRADFPFAAVPVVLRVAYGTKGVQGQNNHT